MAIQPDGRIVAAGQVSGDFGLARYNPDGSLDRTFGDRGKVVTDFGSSGSAYALVIQSDGKIVAAGFSYATDGSLFALARYNPDGTPDASFSFDGKLLTDFEGDLDAATAVALDADGRIIAAGQTDNKIALARYHADGAPDRSFGSDGMVVADLPSDGFFVFGSRADLVIQSDGRIVVARQNGGSTASDFVLLRYLADGSPDSDFGAGGMVVTDFDGHRDSAFALAPQPDGKIIAAGLTGSPIPDFALARYHPDGSLDDSFGTGGKVVTPGPSGPYLDMALQPDGRIVVLAPGRDDATGLNYDFVLLRYNNGTATVAFDPGQQIVTITGTTFDDALELSADQLGRMVVRYNGQFLEPIDTSTGLPCAQQGTCPTIFNTKSVIAPLGAGGDSFAVLGGQLHGIAISVAGQGDADTLIVEVEPPPPAPNPNQPPKVEPPPPLEVSFDGERLHIVGTDRAEDIRVIARPDQHPTPCFDVGVSDPVTQRLLAQITADNVGHFALDAAAGNDRITALLESAGLIAVPLVANFHGGAGDDHMFIDLQNNVSSFAWSVLANGGAGDDFLQTRGLIGAILLGGAGIDEVTGDKGRDVLIGGEDRDSITGGDGQDIIVPGLTSFDANPDALRSIHAFWNSDMPFLERVEYLSGPSDAPFHLIMGESVFDDGADNSVGDHSLDDWLLAPCFVTNTNDSGPGSLREAIECANIAALPALAVVDFRIPTTDPNFIDVDSHLPGGDPDPDAFVISPLSELPPLDNLHGWGIILDARTQTSFGGDTNPFGPEVVLVNLGGVTEPPVATGLRLFSDDNRVFGLNIQRFAGDGIELMGSRNWVAGNYIGTDATGTEDLGNVGHGIAVFGDANIIGTNGDDLEDAAERNLISGNVGNGVWIRSAAYNIVAGNLIGTDATGMLPLGNTGFGVLIQSGGRSNRIGTNGDSWADSAERNVIAANGARGVSIAFGSDRNVIAGNFIGTNVTGGAALPNGSGVFIGSASQSNILGTNGDGVADEAERNLISGNLRDGVIISTRFGRDTTANVVAGNYIGTDVTGTAALSNGGHGISILGAARTNRVGTDADGLADAAERNLISANALNGVHIEGAETDGNVVAGNYIGTDLTGTVGLGNGVDGVRIIEFAANNLIGGTLSAARNLISGNGNEGLRIQNAATGNRVEGNFIGTDVTGTRVLGNASDGVAIVEAHANTIGGTSTSGAGNLISANTLNGVALQGSAATGNEVLGNLIGTDISGRKPLGNFGYGVVINVASNNVIGGTGVGERNIISANRAGAFIGSDVLAGESVGNCILANFIGLDITGLAPLRNAFNGVEIVNRARNNVVDRNVVSSNGEDGIVILGADATNNAVVHNFVGLDATGNAAIGNRDTGVLITGSAHHNLVHNNTLSGNGNAGVDLFAGASDNLVTRNFIGLNVAGTAAIPNTYGVTVQYSADRNIIGTNADGVDDDEEGNVISGNQVVGVLIGGGSFNTVAGNSITMNAGHGVHILGGAVANRIGTDGTSVADDSVEGNVIAGNTLDGVRVAGAETVRNTIRGNSIHSNGLLRIDLGGDGVTDNDARDSDSGPNQLQNYPVLAAALAEGTGTRVRGSLHSLPNTLFTIDFYANAAADPSGHGEGQRRLGAITVTTNRGGTATINHLLDISVEPGEFITATATEGPAANLGNTSEFSATRLVITRGDRAPGPQIASPPPLEYTKDATSDNASRMNHVDQVSVLPQAADHLFGWDREADGLLAETLSLGTRPALGRDTSALAADALFALLGAEEAAAGIDSNPFRRVRVKFA